jgi:hypothetical protein
LLSSPVQVPLLCINFTAGYHASALRLGPRARFPFPLASLSRVVALVPAIRTRGSTSERVQLVISSFDLREVFLCESLQGEARLYS